MCGYNRHGRERTNRYRYTSHFSTRFTKIANDKAGFKVTDVAHGLGRFPSGLYTVVCHSSLEWRTENKPSSVNNGVVEWTGSIPT